MSKKKKAPVTRERRREAEAAANTEKLRLWQERLAQSDREWSPEVARMDRREEIYGGSHKLKPLVHCDQKDNKATHVRNIVFENIESQISSSIPQPKVTPRRQQDEHLAQIIEHFIRNELKRQNFAAMNDMDERTVPIQGGSLFHQEWDNSRRTHTTVGAQKTSLIHPKQLAPQPGVYTDVEDMDWVILKIPTTKEAVWRKYGISVKGESESEPQIRSTGSENLNEDAVTQYIGYARNDTGGIDRYSWVNDKELEDLVNYQARRIPTCARCGRVRPMPGQVISNNVQQLPPPTLTPSQEIRDQVSAGRQMAMSLAEKAILPEDELDGSFLEGIEMVPGKEPNVTYDGGACPWCGGNKWETKEQEYEEVILPVKTKLGREIPGEYPGTDEFGAPVMVPTKIPFYKPDISEINGQEKSYGTGVILDTKLFDGVSPRNWGKVLSDFVYKHLAGTELTVYDENGNPETIHLAKSNERVWKDGAKNSHRVIDKLAGYRGNDTRAKAIVQMSEVLATSKYEKSTDEHSHQWMDENGWAFRKVYLQSEDGNIYEATLNIAKGREYNTLYEINRVHLIDKKETSASIPSTDDRQRPRYQEPGMGRTQSEVSNEASQVPDTKAPSLHVQNELASTPIDSVADRGADVKYSISERQEEGTEKNEITRDGLKGKAKRKLQEHENKLMYEISRALGITFYGENDRMMDIIHEMSDEYLRTGAISDDTQNKLYKRLIEEGKAVNREFFEKYEKVLKHMRKQKITVSREEQKEIVNYREIKDRAWPNIQLVTNGGTTVSEAYQELTAMAPELFPAEIAETGDQLKRIVNMGISIRISENFKADYEGETVSDRMRIVKNDFLAAIGEAASNFREVRRYAEDKSGEKDKPEEISLEEAEELWANLKDARKNYETPCLRHSPSSSWKSTISTVRSSKIFPESIRAKPSG